MWYIHTGTRQDKPVHLKTHANSRGIHPRQYGLSLNSARVWWLHHLAYTLVSTAPQPLPGLPYLSMPGLIL